MTNQAASDWQIARQEIVALSIMAFLVVLIGTMSSCSNGGGDRHDDARKIADEIVRDPHGARKRFLDD